MCRTHALLLDLPVAAFNLTHGQCHITSIPHDQCSQTTAAATGATDPETGDRMSEENTQQDAATAQAEQQDAQTAPKPTETVEFWKQKAREQEARAKANATAAQRLEEIENASKTEQQRAAEALTAAEKRAADAESAALRIEVAAKKGLTPAQAKRLVGSSLEELEADADDLLTNFKPPEPADDSAAVAAALDLGSRGTASVAGDPAADFAKFLKGQLP